MTMLETYVRNLNTDEHFGITFCLKVTFYKTFFDLTFPSPGRDVHTGSSYSFLWNKNSFCKFQSNSFFWDNEGERIIIPLDRRSGQLKSTSPGLYQLPNLFYTGLAYTGCLLHQLATPHAMVPVQKRPVQKIDLMFNIVYTSSLVYTGNTGVYNKAPVQMYDYALPQ